MSKKEREENPFEIAFIGKRENYFQEPFSIPSAIFGPFYFLYRKDWTLTVIIMICYFASHIYMLYNSITEDIGLLFRLILNIIYGFLFNSHYLTLVKKKVEWIKETNPNDTEKELLEKCKKQGGTLPIGFVILAVILYIIGIILLNQTK